MVSSITKQYVQLQEVQGGKHIYAEENLDALQDTLSATRRQRAEVFRQLHITTQNTNCPKSAFMDWDNGSHEHHSQSRQKAKNHAHGCLLRWRKIWTESATRCIKVRSFCYLVACINWISRSSKAIHSSSTSTTHLSTSQVDISHGSFAAPRPDECDYVEFNSNTFDFHSNSRVLYGLKVPQL